MGTREITIVLPETLAREAEAIDLLRPETLRHLLQEEIRRRRVDGLFAAADRLSALPLTPLGQAEIEAEIQAARRERRGSNAHRG